MFFGEEIAVRVDENEKNEKKCIKNEQFYCEIQNVNYTSNNEIVIDNI